MLRLQPSEISLTQAEVQQWTRNFAARKIASSAAREFARTHGHHASARIQRGPERSRDDALVTVPENYLPDPRSGSTESSEDLPEDKCSPSESDMMAAYVSYEDASEGASHNHEYSEEGSSLEELPEGLDSLKIEDPSSQRHARSPTRRFRPRSWSDPAGSSEIPELYLPPRRYQQSASPDPLRSPINRSSTMNPDGRPPWIDGGTDAMSEMAPMFPGRHPQALMQFALARGGRPRMPVWPMAPIRHVQTPRRGSDEENEDNYLQFAAMPAEGWSMGGVVDNPIMASTPPDLGRLRAQMRRAQESQVEIARRHWQ